MIATGVSLFAKELPLTDFAVGFWPEYDHPGVLVTFSMSADEASLPIEFEIELPEGAKMALKTNPLPNGEQELVPQIIEEADGKTVMPVKMENTMHYIQFYYNPFDPESQRQLDYRLAASADLPAFSVIIQENLAAENFSSSLTEPERVRDEFGFTYQRQIFSGLKSGEALNVMIKYENPGGRFSVDVLQEIMAQHSEFGMGAGEQPSRDSAVRGLNRWQMILVPLSAVGFIVVVLLMFRTSRKQQSRKNTVQYCTECGAALDKEQSFCPACGHKQRTS